MVNRVNDGNETGTHVQVRVCELVCSTTIVEPIRGGSVNTIHKVLLAEALV
jgi:hypothetical protein